MKIMISQPMQGKCNEEISKQREKVVKMLTEQGHEVVNTIFDFGDKPPLYYLAKSIEAMSECDGVFFMKDWLYARGCAVEHSAAVEYKLWIGYECRSEQDKEDNKQ